MTPPAFALGESHISFQLRSEKPSAMDRMELFHTPPECYGSWRFIVAVPATQASDDPGCARQALHRMRVLLPISLAFERRDERLDGVHLRLGKHCGARKLMFAIALLRQLDIDASRLHRRRCQLLQAFRRGNLTIFQLQSLGFQHPVQLLDNPATLVPAYDLPCPGRKACLLGTLQFSRTLFS